MAVLRYVVQLKKLKKYLVETPDNDFCLNLHGTTYISILKIAKAHQWWRSLYQHYGIFLARIKNLITRWPALYHNFTTGDNHHWWCLAILFHFLLPNFYCPSNMTLISYEKIYYLSLKLQKKIVSLLFFC